MITQRICSLYHSSPFILSLFPMKCKMAAAATILFLNLNPFITSVLNGNVILNACSVTSSLSAGQVPPTVLGPLCPQYGFLHAKSPPPQNPQPTVYYSICAPDLFLTNPHTFPFPEGPDRPMDQLDAPRQHPHFSFTPLRHIAFRQFGFLVNPSQPLFFFLFFYSIVFLRLSSRTGEKPSSEYIS